MQGLEVERLQN